MRLWFEPRKGGGRTEEKEKEEKEKFVKAKVIGPFGAAAQKSRRAEKEINKFSIA